MSDDKQMTRADWERERATELNSKTVTDLASKVATLEYDLKAKRDELAELQGKLPKEGERVISKAEGERLDAYAALGKPDDLKAALDDRATLTTEKAQRERKDALSAAADAAGYKTAVLERLAPDGVTFTVRDEERDGQTVKTAYVTDADGKDTPLAEYVQANYADFLPALTRQPDAPQPAPDARPLWAPQPRDLTPPAPDAATLDAQKRAQGDYTF